MTILWIEIPVQTSNTGKSHLKAMTAKMQYLVGDRSYLIGKLF
jgi:hypothetical protein